MVSTAATGPSALAYTSATGPSLPASAAEPALPPAASWPVLPPEPGLEVGLQIPLWGESVEKLQVRPLEQSEVISQRSPSPWLHPPKSTRVPARAKAELIARDCMGSWVSTAAQVCEVRKRRPRASLRPCDIAQS